MLAKIHSYGISGLEAYPIQIEVDVSNGLPLTTIVGLPDNAIKESKERVRSAIKNSGYSYEPRRITVNLSPADIKKEGPSFDLAIALGILAATEQIDPQTIDQYAILGELSLDGTIKPVSGVLSIALSAVKNNLKGIILPVENASEAALINHTRVYPAKNLNDVVYILSNIEKVSSFSIPDNQSTSQQQKYDIDFADVKGQAHVKRGLEIAAAGSHNVLLVGTQYNR